MLSKTGTYNQIFPFFLESSIRIGREQHKIRTQNTAHKGKPHDTSMIMSGKRQICSPLKIYLSKSRCMRQKNVQSFFFRFSNQTVQFLQIRSFSCCFRSLHIVTLRQFQAKEMNRFPFDLHLKFFIFQINDSHLADLSSVL